ncbi:MAG: hypothetical protein U0R44_01105 [Candidatus Micrarchaeia archaeon]
MIAKAIYSRKMPAKSLDQVSSEEIDRLKAKERADFAIISENLFGRKKEDS